MKGCTFPTCGAQSCCANGSGQPMCKTHQPVTVTGSWVSDRHDVSSGGEH